MKVLAEDLGTGPVPGDGGRTAAGHSTAGVGSPLRAVTA